ncbi:hypothetical protein EJB05_28842, partial [Eragrostis curvula]
MEAAVASGILKVAGSKLVLLLASEFAAITGMGKDLSELQDIHGELEGWLSAVRDLSIEKDRRFGWVIKLRDVANDVFDLLTEVHLEAEKHKIASGDERHAIFDRLSAKPRSFLYRYKVAHKIKAIKVRLAAIMKQRSGMNSIGNNLALNQPIQSRNRATGELSLLTNVEESQISIRDQEKVEIVSKLLESNEDDGWIVSIVGLGGSGKTTLAKHICHENKIKEHFKDNMFWVHVSQEFDVEKLIDKLFEAIIGQMSKLHTRQHMLHEISNKLSGKKFLLVLDDAWHTEKFDLEQFMVHLKSGASGSKILLTTRDRKVAEVVKSSHIFQLAFLSSLFINGFELAEEDFDSEFKNVGKEILKRCGGVPLAIKTLGGILSDKREINTWRAIIQSDLWNDKNTEVRVFASLKLSYIHLKDYLKQCFTFCSIFPKGYSINKNNLIEQWIVHGFVNQMMNEEPEVTGSEYFNSLVKVGFFQDAHESWDDIGVAYKMHDLIHDLTRYILESEVVISLRKNMTKDCTRKCRYLSLTSSRENVDSDRVSFDKVRALYVSEGNLTLDKLVKKSRYIFSVVLNCAIDTPFPLFILKLDYLGYLEIYYVSCTILPEAISGCWNLQSLHFIDCNGFVTLPKSIGKLKKLRTLELISTDIESLPQSISHCRDLQALQISICEEFREIPNIIGKNENLRVLQIVECENLQLPSEFIGEFSNIQTINLAGCSSLVLLPSTFYSDTLRTLNLSQTRVTKLPEWVTLVGTLECISLENCWDLEELPRGIGNLKRLESLNLNGCIRLNWMPSGFAQLTRLKRLDLFVVGCGEDDARISDIENLDIISGCMQIKKLENLMDSNDAEKACLKQKENIRDLRMTWSESLMEKELVSDLRVLDALEPPSEIEKLRIDGYRGSHLPCWMSKQSDSSYLEGPLLKQSGQPRFHCLIHLGLSEMPNLKRVQGILVLPSLKSIMLFRMPILDELWTITSGLGIGKEVSEQYCFPILSDVQICCCPKLVVKPYFPPSVKSLALGYDEHQVSSGGSFFRSSPPCGDEPSSSNGVLAMTHLKNLKLYCMDVSASDWGSLQHLARLESLDISLCRLTELPVSMLGLTSLQSLRIFRCTSLAVLPEWIGELRSLQELDVSVCPLMSSLPRSIEHLISLTRLEFNDCPSLQSLPGSIQHLSSLQRLDIIACPDLARRYKKEVGEDWNLVSHIPYVTIV